jgi:hypothetical protein
LSNISHSSIFWDAEFETHLAKELAMWLDQVLNSNINENLTLEEIIESWINKATENSGGIVD